MKHLWIKTVLMISFVSSLKQVTEASLVRADENGGGSESAYSVHIGALSVCRGMEQKIYEGLWSVVRIQTELIDRSYLVETNSIQLELKSQILRLIRSRPPRFASYDQHTHQSGNTNQPSGQIDRGDEIDSSVLDGAVQSFVQIVSAEPLSDCTKAYYQLHQYRLELRKQAEEFNQKSNAELRLCLGSLTKTESWRDAVETCQFRHKGISLERSIWNQGM